jgi:hypothetical protein
LFDWISKKLISHSSKQLRPPPRLPALFLRFIATTANLVSDTPLSGRLPPVTLARRKTQLQNTPRARVPPPPTSLSVELGESKIT